jgi:2-oxoglutarate ferredoxin oxidoreductase subunit delta
VADKFKKFEYQHKAITWATFPEICKSCGLCIEKCPMSCLAFDKEKIEYLGLPAVTCEVEKCIACRTCENVCPEGAIRVDGKK